MHGSEHARPDSRAWVAEAACRGMDPALFIPPKDGASIRNIARAKAVCAICPVIDDCRREHATEPLGIWFGTTPGERGEHGTVNAFRRHRRNGEEACAACKAAVAEASRRYRAARKEAAS